MHRTTETRSPIRVMTLDKAKAEETVRVILVDCVKPIAFEVIIHRDVVAGELLELEKKS